MCQALSRHDLLLLPEGYEGKDRHVHVTGEEAEAQIGSFRRKLGQVQTGKAAMMVRGQQAGRGLRP